QDALGPFQVVDVELADAVMTVAGLQQHIGCIYQHTILPPRIRICRCAASLIPNTATAQQNRAEPVLCLSPIIPAPRQKSNRKPKFYPHAVRPNSSPLSGSNTTTPVPSVKTSGAPSLCQRSVSPPAAGMPSA